VVDIDDKPATPRAKPDTNIFGAHRGFRHGRKFDLIMMLNLIEHVRDPVAVLQKMKRHAGADGLILIKTPNYDSLDARIFRHRNWVGLHCPRHWVISRGKLRAACPRRAACAAPRPDAGRAVLDMVVLKRTPRLALSTSVGKNRHGATR